MKHLTFALAVLVSLSFVACTSTSTPRAPATPATATAPSTSVEPVCSVGENPWRPAYHPQRIDDPCLGPVLY